MRTEGDIVAIYGDNGTKYATYLYFCFDYIRRTWRTMNKVKKHMIADILLHWLFVVGFAYFGCGKFPGMLLGVPLVMWFALKRTFFWGKILLDLKFSEPQKIITKCYQSACRLPVYGYEFCRLRYSEVTFSDPRLPGKYVYFDVAIYRGGDELEVTYYKRSRYIVDIKLLKPLENKKANQNPNSIKLKRSLRPRPKR